MNIEQLEKGQELLELIKVTEIGLKGIKDLISEKKDNKEKHFYDGLYWLNISKHKDGSGSGGELYRYHGNEELLQVIKDTLQKQLNEYNLLFDTL